MAAQIQIGQRLEIKDPMSLNDWYSTRIEDLTDGMLVIGAPMKSGTLVPIGVGSTVSLQFPQDDAFYSFSAEVVQRRAGDLPVLVLRRPSAFERVQRRRLYRLQVNLDVQYTPLGGGEAKKAITLDISGGGVCISVPERIEPGMELDLEVQMEKGWSFSAHGCVVKCTELSERGPGGKARYAVGIEFMNLPAPVQDDIVSFIFAKQRERRQREVGI